MAAWSSLSPEIKRHIVKKLDFMSRHALRNTCHLEREIVDSTICKLPRVRFGYKEGKCLIVIYTGIDQFLRFEIEEFEERVVAFKMENSYERKSASIRFTPEFNSEKRRKLRFTIPLGLFRWLLNHDAIEIQVMEYEIWEMSHLSKIEKDETIARLFKFLETAVYKVHELAFTRANDPTVKLGIEKLMKKRNGNVSRTIQLIPIPLNTTVAMSFEEQDVHEDGIIRYNTDYILTDPDNPSIYPRYGSLSEKKSPSLRTLRLPEPKCDPKNCGFNRIPDGRHVGYVRMTKCGHALYGMKRSDESYFKKLINFKKCGLDDMCPNCADPFDYWYTQNLPRRLSLEPFWNGIIQLSNEFSLQDYKNLRNKLTKQEKKKTNDSNGKVAAWGFKPNLLSRKEQLVNSSIRWSFIKYVLPVFFVFVVYVIDDSFVDSFRSYFFEKSETDVE